MQFLIRLLLVLLLTATLRAGDSLAHARQAQALLGPETWTQIIRIENTARFGRYPHIVYALVFELADILWFYTDTDGTQSFSLHKGRLAEEKADFGPLLRDIERGFAHWTVVADDTSAAKATGELPDGCFIASVAALRNRLQRGGPVARPSLLSYYVDSPRGRRGHTVLTYEVDGQLEVIDTGRPAKPERYPVALEADPLALARTLAGDRIVVARWVPVELSDQQIGSGLVAARATTAAAHAM